MKTIFSKLVSVSIALILAQSLYFKFSAHPDSVAIFRELGMGDSGRILIGVLELIAATFLIVPKGQAWGGLLAWGLMTGAMIGHWSQLGWVGDRGILGALGIYCWVGSAVVVALNIKRIPVLGDWRQE
ncbi:DoxX family protein [Pelagicoccus sp. SDUM812003]|uniref:DoxX family protein n=1 Tax=Pelagicoccus sp. SDUM812003 TaxID=3041267 RepID=UPI00281055DB|nr:DoxX family protein [Pelagicoccus sp. SDUM812003]MDQ8202206.1 DoxX family protein [Pelagicoccus sp. SDUM812003]